MKSKRMVKQGVLIGNASGYWGDDPTALRRQVEGAIRLDYLTLDFLAEVTMSVLHKQRARNPLLGFAADFVDQVVPVLPQIKSKNIRIITNAGGLNPRGCAEALLEEAAKRGVALRIAVVEGDDLSTRIDQIIGDTRRIVAFEQGGSLRHLRGKIVAANAYLGARPIAHALKSNPDIVITGRVIDAGLTLGPLIHEFGWKAKQYDLLAAGIAAGHLIECGAQVSGGNFTDWGKVRSFIDVGFPIVECFSDGSFVVTKQPKSGGLVSCQTVREQLLYEVGDPGRYSVPDCSADFRSIVLRQIDKDRVHVSGVRGGSAPHAMKVSIAYTDGFRCVGTTLVSGPHAREKAQIVADAFWKRLRSELKRELGKSSQKKGAMPLRSAASLPREMLTEFLGADATSRQKPKKVAPSEILLRLCAQDSSREKLAVMRKLVPSLILSGPPGLAVTGGAPAISEVVSFAPALVRRTEIEARISVIESAQRVFMLLEELSEELEGGAPLYPRKSKPSMSEDPHRYELPKSRSLVQVPLVAICHTRSGDKGDLVNLALIGRSSECYAWLRDNLSIAELKRAAPALCRGRLERFLAPGLWGINFVISNALGGGGATNLRIDAQGKTVAQAVLDFEVAVPGDLLSSIATSDQPNPRSVL